MIIYRKTYENITLFHYSGCYHILFETHGYCLYLNPWEILFSRNIGGHYLKALKKYIYHLQNNPWEKL